MLVFNQYEAVSIFQANPFCFKLMPVCECKKHIQNVWSCKSDIFVEARRSMIYSRY